MHARVPGTRRDVITRRGLSRIAWLIQQQESAGPARLQVLHLATEDHFLDSDQAKELVHAITGGPLPQARSVAGHEGGALRRGASMRLRRLSMSSPGSTSTGTGGQSLTAVTPQSTGGGMYRSPEAVSLPDPALAPPTRPQEAIFMGHHGAAPRLGK